LTANFTFEAGNSLAFRIYPDNQPRNLEIAPLQKGLVLVRSGEELIEEGAGFGVPVVKYVDHTFFCSTAQVYVEQHDPDRAVVRKVFFLDTVSEKHLRGASINGAFYSVFHDGFERAYLTRQSLRPVFDWMMSLRKTIGVNTHFTKATPRGKIVVTYNCHHDIIKVNVDLSALDKKNCQEILILNEQGAQTFRRYSDIDGTVLYDRQVGAWAKVAAKQAFFSDIRQTVFFSLQNHEKALLFRGREQIKDRFSWAGMTYSLNPEVSAFEYGIKTELSQPVHGF
jgi:hypothetical protein